MDQILEEFRQNAVMVAQVLVLVAVPTGIMLSHVWTQYQITEMGYEIASVTSEHRDLLEENKKLTVEARMQGRSDRVAEVAMKEFGLQEMDPDQIVTLEGQEDEAPSEELVQLSAAEGDQAVQ